MNKKSYLIRLLPAALLLSAFISACENEIPLHLGSIPPTLTMNAFIYADSLTNRLYLSLTGEIAPQPPGDVTVEVTVNGEQKEVLHAIPLPDTPLCFADITTRFRPGDVVRIDARTGDGRHHAWTEETLPHPVAIEQVDTSQVLVPPKPYYYSTHRNMRFRIRFTDPPGRKNYYRILLEQRYTVRGTTTEGIPVSTVHKEFGYWPWEDLALTAGRPATSEELDAELFERETNLYGVFNDSWFKDNAYTLNVQVRVANRLYYPEKDFLPESLDLDVIVRLLSITESEYYYLTTMNMIDSGVLDDYISDPVKLPCNIHGGNGFVGISSENSKTIRILEGERVES